MTREEIVELARQSGFFIRGRDHVEVPFVSGSSITALLANFAHLVAVAEWTACLEAADGCADADMNAAMAANAIRARRHA